MTLAVESVSVTMAARALLRPVSFTARRGEFIVIAGPNGAGKTTLVKAIAGLLPFAGRITWDGRCLTAMTARERARTLAFLPQGNAAHWPITAREAVAIGRAPFSSSLARLNATDSGAIDAALAAVEAEEFAGRPITELSGGERARVLLARALAVGAPVLIADEPVAALDPAHQLAVMTILAERARAGDLVIAISHDLLLAARFAHRIAVLNRGELVAFGLPAEALTTEVLREVFAVEALPVQADGHTLNLPWRVHRTPVR